MNFKLNLRIKVFIIAVVIIVIGQVGFSIKNVQLFKESYIHTLNAKYENLAVYIKKDVEKILSVGIPLTKLIKMEESLHSILETGNELEFIEITDKKDNLLYLVNRENMERFEPGAKKSLLDKSETLQAIRDADLDPKDTNVVIPITNPKTGNQEGSIKLHISPQKIQDKSEEILLDMITVILTSLLITFELLGFFVAYEVSSPLQNISRQMSKSIRSYAPMSIHSFLFIDELTDIIDKFNRRIYRLKTHHSLLTSEKKYLPRLREGINCRIENQLELVKSLKDRLKNSGNKMAGGFRRENLDGMSTALVNLKQQLNAYSEKIKTVEIGFYSKASTEKTQGMIYYEFIRPLVFLFIMADGFCLSFLPMYIDSLYEPMLGLPREMVIALPISLFMLTLAAGMPIGGAVTDKFGWYGPLLFGILVNVVGHVATGLSTNIHQLIFFRCITAIGFALFFMSCQQFIIANTSVNKRAMGMSSFLAAFFSGDICGTVLGGMLVNRIGYSWVFYSSAAFSLITFAITFMIFNQYKAQQKKPKTDSGHGTAYLLKNVFSIFKDGEFCTILFLQAIPAKMVLVGFLYYFVPIYLKSIGVLQASIGRTIICYGLAMVLLGPVLSKLLGRISYRKYNVFIGGLITAIALLAFKMYPSYIMIIGIVFSIGIAHTFSMSSQAAIISETRLVKNLGAGTGMGVFRFWERIGNIFGPLLIGYFISIRGYSFSIVVLGSISLALSLAYISIVLYKTFGPAALSDFSK
ncbi:MAG: MFS transporter [Thermodesulfobacteriota bacterium]